MTIPAISYQRVNHLLIVIALLLIPVTSNAVDWPQYRGLQGDGQTTEGITAAPAELWRKTVGSGMSSVITYGGRVFAIGHYRTGAGRGNNVLYCLDAGTGAEIWSFTYN